jgi:hypothetical protein
MNADPHPHHERGHSTWAASATARNVVCAGAIALQTLCEDRETEAAAWGSAAHQISERCLKGNFDAISLVGRVEKSGKFEFSIDEEMCNTAQAYVDYCRDGQEKYLQETGDVAQFWIEQKLSLDALNPALEAGGTGDFVIYFPRWRLLEIVDLKGGKGVFVDVKGNMQGRSYAVEALLTLPDIIVDRVMVTIIQPRSGDGLPRSETFHVADLLDWTVDLLVSIQRAKTALDEFKALGGNRVLFDEWADRWLRTGQCTFCSAQGICPARRKEALAAMPALAARWFEEPDAPMPDLSNTPRLASPEELARWLDGFEAIEDWIKAVRGHAHAEAERGVTIPGYQLADRIGNRAWKNEDATIRALWDAKFTKEQIYEEKLRSPAQIEKILGAKRKAEIAPLVERPKKGTNLVSSALTTRPAAAAKSERYFEEL